MCCVSRRPLSLAQVDATAKRSFDHKFTVVNKYFEVNTVVNKYFEVNTVVNKYFEVNTVVHKYFEVTKYFEGFHTWGASGYPDQICFPVVASCSFVTHTENAVAGADARQDNQL